MHKLDVLILGPPSFISTLNELKTFLKFNPLSSDLKGSPNIILFHTNAFRDKKLKKFIEENNCIRICVGAKKDLVDSCDASLELPTTLKEINAIIENTSAKKKFNTNSSVVVKSYFLDKNLNRINM